MIAQAPEHSTPWLTVKLGTFSLFDHDRVKSLLETKRFNVECILIKPSQALSTFVACTQIAGTGVHIRWKPQSSRESYPKPTTVTDDEAASIEVLRGLSTRDLVVSGSEPDCEIMEPSGQVGFPEREGRVIPCKTNQKTATTKTANRYKRYPLGVREKLNNGRWKCAHKCQGTCHHLCCKEGVAKPPRIRAEKQPSSPQSRATQREPCSSFPPNEKPPLSNHNKVSNVIRKVGDGEDAAKASLTSSFQTQSKNLAKRTKTIGAIKGSRVERADHDSDLPSLIDLEDFASPETEEIRPRSSVSFKESSQIPEEILQAESNPSTLLRGAQGHEIVKGVNLHGKGREEFVDMKGLSEASGIEKFRNKTKVVDYFDEKEIFRQRNDIASSCDALKSSHKKPSLETTDKSISLSSSQCQPNSDNLDCASSQNSKEEDETDELEEDWDIKIFQGYLSPDIELVDQIHTPSQMTKRNIDQIREKVRGAAPKKSKVDSTHGRHSSNQPFVDIAEDPRTPGSEHQDTCWDKELKVASCEDPLMTKPTIRSPGSPDSSSSNDVEDDPDPLMKMADEVMAWAESHVAQD